VVLGWLDTDRVLPITGVLAAAALLFLRRLRFVAVVLLPVLFALRPGYLPMAYVIGLLPFLALAVGAVFDLLVSAGMPRAATNPLAATDSSSHRRQLTPGECATGLRGGSRGGRLRRAEVVGRRYLRRPPECQ